MPKTRRHTREAGGHQRDSTAQIKWLAGVIALTVITYSQAPGGGFVLDSRFLVLQDQRVHSWTAENLRLILQQSYWWPIDASGLYRPVTTLSILLNYVIAGESAAAYHLVNLGLHVLNVVLVFLVCRSVAASSTTALLASALWAVAPIGSEVVANIAGRADLLSTTFLLAGFLSYVHATAASQRIPWMVALSVCLTLAIFSKESAVVLVPLVIAHAIATRDRGALRKPVGLILALGIPMVLLFAARWRVLGQLLTNSVPFVDNPIAHATWIEGRLTALRVLGDYLKLFAWPHPLFADYSYPQVRVASGTTADFVGWTVLLFAIGLAILFRRNRTAVIGFLIALAAILPVSNLLFPIGTVMAERLMYVASIGLCLACVAMAQTMAKTAIARTIAVIVFACGLAAWSVRTFVRTDDWESNLTLWTSAAAHGTDSAKAHRALAEALYDADPSRRNLPTVIAHARRATTLVDDVPLALRAYQDYRQLAAYSLDQANLLSSSGNKMEHAQESRAAATTALRILEQHPDVAAATTITADVYRIRASANTILGFYADGAQDASQAIEIDPLSEHAYLLAADALLAMKDPNGAAQRLAVGAMVLPSPRLSDELVKLYRAVDPDGCSLQLVGGATMVNPQCPVVSTHLCAASVEGVRLLRKLGRTEPAQALAARSRQTFGCGVT